jgi:3-oxoacyl-[acyl-carrier protein] reductase
MTQRLTLDLVDDPQISVEPRRSTYPDLAGKIAVVTGGSRGIGAATARALAANRATVALVGRDREALTAQTNAITTTGRRALAVVADCSVLEQLQHAAEEVARQLGPVEILAAFAGGRGEPVPTAQESLQHWQAVLETNLTATFLTVQTFLPVMIERRQGAIITMSSSAARQPERTSAAYAAAKAGVIALTRQLASETAAHGIRVNCLAPASTLNERMQAHMSDQQLEQLASAFPLGRIALPRDIADAAAFLASDASSWMTGVTLDIAGGKIMR